MLQAPEDNLEGAREEYDMPQSIPSVVNPLMDLRIMSYPLQEFNLGLDL